MSITNDVVFVVIGGKMAINLVVLVDSVVDTVLICAENRRIVFVAVFDDVFVYVVEILLNEGPNSSVGRYLGEGLEQWVSTNDGSNRSMTCF